MLLPTSTKRQTSTFVAGGSKSSEKSAVRSKNADSEYEQATALLTQPAVPAMNADNVKKPQSLRIRPLIDVAKEQLEHDPTLVTRDIKHLLRGPVQPSIQPLLQRRVMH